MAGGLMGQRQSHCVCGVMPGLAWSQSRAKPPCQCVPDTVHLCHSQPSASEQLEKANKVWHNDRTESVGEGQQECNLKTRTEKQLQKRD